ncbi:3-phosphoglycerate dehydrogenase [Acuticoccus sediminis]|uniref:3-phosphoglycerate dehydrogenase n=1 Tax=Acuticoccus sediminis TaxID=2184697 RepID=A0A8B2NJV2_9HYPH|nr:2-hydroxyacid dehydrogenase [Acuticoccus sediminis]RAH99904.1 3-phosphoglycerate dehydrogenase [Acuticoccus sediminis]
MMDTIVFLDPMSPERLARLEQFASPRFAVTTAASRAADDQLHALQGARFAITGDVPVTARMMREGAAGGLEAVHKWGVGYDNIDLDAARAAGVRVFRTTGGNSVAVAESALALMLAVNRQTVAGHIGVLDGKWLKGELGPRIYTLSGKTVGLVGLGYIGKALARLLTGFGCRTLYTKPTPLSPAEEAGLNAAHVPLATLLAESDVVSLHCALTPETMGLIGREALAAMKQGAIIVNTARGGILDENALADAIESGHIRGAGIDVYETEPVPPENRLVGLKGVVTTPHIAALAADNFGKTVNRMLDNLARVAAGEPVPELDVLV